MIPQVESSLQYEAGPVRKNSFKILRNLLAKHDCDPRYTDPVSQYSSAHHLYFIAAISACLVPYLIGFFADSACSPSACLTMHHCRFQSFVIAFWHVVFTNNTPTLCFVQGQKARIASLYFPLIPLVMSHVSRLDTGSPCYVSPMLNAASMAFYDQAHTPLSKTFDHPTPSSATGSTSAY